MMRSAFIILLSAPFIFASCKKCKQCSYTYTKTSIVQTVNGEEEVTKSYNGVLSGPDGQTFSEECIKKDETFTIEQWYQAKQDTTVLDDFQFTCKDT